MIRINPGEINWLAVIVAALATFMIGGVWYTVLFGKAWQRLNGYSDEKLAQMRAQRPPPVFFGTMLICYLLVALVAAVLVVNLGLATAMQGAVLGLALWVLVGAVQMTGHIASDKPMAALGIDVLYQLIYMPLTGAIVAAWR